MAQGELHATFAPHRGFLFRICPHRTHLCRSLPPTPTCVLGLLLRYGAPGTPRRATFRTCHYHRLPATPATYHARLVVTRMYLHRAGYAGLRGDTAFGTTRGAGACRTPRPRPYPCGCALPPVCNCLGDYACRVTCVPRGAPCHCLPRRAATHALYTTVTFSTPLRRYHYSARCT